MIELSSPFAEIAAVLAHIGIAVLFGLKLDLHIVRSLGSVALATALGQVAFASAVGFVICLALGLSTVTSAYVAVALTFSSTIIIVKLLSIWASNCSRTCTDVRPRARHRLRPRGAAGMA